VADAQHTPAAPEWRPVRRRRAFEEVVDQIEEQIAAGRLRPGDRLPGERHLAATLGVSRPSVREAMRVLEAMGVLVANTGSGPDAGAILTDTPGPALAGVLRLHVGLTNFAVDDVVEARALIERWAVEAAARRRRPRDVARLRSIVDRMDDPSAGLDEFRALDTELHVAIAEVAGNAVVATLMRALRDTVARQQRDAVDRLGEDTTALRADHHRLVDAIAAGDAKAAAAALEAHLGRAYRGVTGRPGRRDG
jgi:DNA-binding FadR family transcriptional regulator